MSFLGFLLLGTLIVQCECGVPCGHVLEVVVVVLPSNWRQKESDDVLLFFSGSKVEQGNQRCCSRCGPEINLRRPLRRYSTTTTTFPPLLFPRLLIGTTFFFFPPVSCRCCLRRHDTTAAAADVARKTQRPQLDFNCPAAAAPTANLIVCFNYSVRTVLLVCLAGG